VIRRAVQAALVCVLIAACDNPVDAYPGQVTTSFDNGKRLVVVAGYSLNAQAIGIQAWADVSAGTPGTIEMTGPLHMRCDGSFQLVPAEFDNPGNRPTLDVGEGHIGAQLHAPSGNYTAVAAIPSKKVKLKKTFTAGTSAIDPLTGVWDLPGGCVPVADTRQQLLGLTTKNVNAIAYWVGRMDASPLQSNLLKLAARANDAVVAGDTPTALDALVRIRSSVSAISSNTYEYRTYCESNASIALLSQAVPAN
jgi:hypothetical protein